MTDSVLVFPPGFRVTDADGAPMSGAKIKFYNAGTTNTRTVYSDSGLTQSLGTVVYTGSDGFPVASSGSSTEVKVYTGTTAYKVVITDDSDVELLTLDSIAGALDTSTFLTTSSTSTLSIPVVTKTGNYTLVAGDRGKLINANATGGAFTLTLDDATTLGDGWNVKIRNSGTSNAPVISTAQTIAYAGTTSTTLTLAVGEAVELVCDAAGFNVANLLPFPTIPKPQGYLTPTSATPIITGDVSAATSVYYTPFEGNLVPLWNGVRFMPTVFSELTLSLSASHSGSAHYDVFIYSNSGTPQIVTGPAWTTATAGSGARGSGAGTTQISRVNGFLVNAVAMTGRNGSTTYSVGAGYGTYVGSIFIDSSAGQVTCHRSYGQSRKWGIWNAYNRQPILLKVGDATTSWNYTTNTVRQSNGAAGNTAAVFTGLAEEPVEAVFEQTLQVGTSGANPTNKPQIGIGVNSTTTFSGRRGELLQQFSAATLTANYTIGARYADLLAIGLHNINCLETAIAAGATLTQYGTSDFMMMTVRYRG